MKKGKRIPLRDRTCQECKRTDPKIIDRDSSAIVLECQCGKKWTLFFEVEL